jgi:uncharacterized RDD family membrane protein YckC
MARAVRAFFIVPRNFFAFDDSLPNNCEVKFNCPHCSQKIDAPPEYAGAVINCPVCQKELQVPAAPSAPPKLSINQTSGAPVAAAPAASTPVVTPEVVDAAPLPARIVAKAVDYVLQITVMLGTTLLWRYVIGKNLLQNGMASDTYAMIGTVVLVFVSLFPFFYNYLLLASSGATWGKSMFGLTVVRGLREPPGYAWALLRVVVEYVCVGICYGIALMIFIGVVRAQMHGPTYSPPQMPAPGMPFTPPVSHPNHPLKLVLVLPVFLLVLIPYVPAFFTKGRRAAHDLIAGTRVIKR